MLKKTLLVGLLFLSACRSESKCEDIFVDFLKIQDAIVKKHFRNEKGEYANVNGQGVQNYSMWQHFKNYWFAEKPRPCYDFKVSFSDGPRKESYKIDFIEKNLEHFCEYAKNINWQEKMPDLLYTRSNESLIYDNGTKISGAQCSSQIKRVTFVFK